MGRNRAVKEYCISSPGSNPGWDTASYEVLVSCVQPACLMRGERRKPGVVLFEAVADWTAFDAREFRGVASIYLTSF
jgi:hypothetical protein